MRELEATLQRFGEFILKARLVREGCSALRSLGSPVSHAARRRRTARGPGPPVLRGTGAQRRASRTGRCVQAEQALRIYFVNFLKQHRVAPAGRPAQGRGRARRAPNPLAALEQLRTALPRRGHYSYRTECTYVDWVRRFLDYAAEQQGVPHPRVDVGRRARLPLHLAVRQHVSASTQNQAVLRHSCSSAEKCWASTSRGCPHGRQSQAGQPPARRPEHAGDRRACWTAMSGHDRA